MSRLALHFLLGLLLAGCTPREAPPALGTAPAAGADTQAVSRSAGETYACGGFRFTVEQRAGGDSARIVLPDGAVVLPRVVSASGTRFSDGTTTFWSHGDEASLETRDTAYAGCTRVAGASPWEDAAARGVRFRAVGNEPGWYLTIDDARIAFVGDYGAREVIVPRPDPETNATQTIYRATTEAHRLTVTVTDETCQDTMSDETFEAVVTVVLDGATYRGCGRALG